MRSDRIGACEWSLPITGPAACRFAAQVGLTGIQLDIGPYEHNFPMSKEFVQDLYLEEADRYKLEFPSMAVRVSDYYSMVSAPGSEEYEIVRDGVLKAVKACGRMNIPITMIPNFVKSYIYNEKELDTVCGVMREACDVASELNVTVAAENTLHPEKMIEMFDKVDRPNFRLYFDTQNYYLANDDYTPDILEALYEYIVQIHVKDGRGKELSGAQLGEGDAAFYESIKVLKNRGYDGWLVLENYYDMKPLCSPDGDPVEILRRDVETLKRVTSE